MKKSSMRQLGAIFFLAITAVLVFGFWFYSSQAEMWRRHVEAELQAIVSLQVEQVSLWRENLLLGAIFSHNPLFIEEVKKFVQDPETYERGNIIDFFQALKELKGLEDAMLVDSRGRILLSLRENRPVFYSEQAFLAKALSEKKRLLTDLYLEPVRGWPSIDSIIPLQVDWESEGLEYAVILHADARKELYPIIEKWPVPNISAETFIIRREGGDVLFLSDSRNPHITAFNLKVPLEQSDDPAVQAVLGREGFVRGMNYRGEEVVAFLRAVPDSSWYMVAKMDVVEAFAEWRAFSSLILAIISMMLFLTMVSVAYVWQGNERAHYKALARTQEALKRIEWMLSPRKQRAVNVGGKREVSDSSRTQPFRLISNSVGYDVLKDIADDYVDLLDTAVVIYEKNGDYAYKNLASPWCQFLDEASKKRCSQDDVPLCACYESGWGQISYKAVQRGEPVDEKCSGGIHIYSIPIWAHGQVAGAISMSYGDPPLELEELKGIAGRYGVNLEELKEHARNYETRPLFIIDIAKERLHGSARLVGAMIEHMARLEAANRELNAFAYSVSHDLRAPLRAIDGFSKIIQEDYGDQFDAEGRRLLGVVRSNTEKMDQLITDLLTLSRATRADVQKSLIDMRAQAQAAFQEAAAAAGAPGIDFSVEEDLPEAKGDPGLLRQVWMNLLQNAIKYSRPKDRPVIRVGGYREKGSNVYFVRDNGVGFNPKYTHKIFGIFQRLHKAEEFEGTGIGLAIVQRIIQRHEGEVWAVGQVGQGATFYFTLPEKEG